MPHPLSHKCPIPISPLCLTFTVHVCAAFSHSVVTGVEEITPVQSSLTFTTLLKLFITQMHDRDFGLIGPYQVYVESHMRSMERTVHSLQPERMAVWDLYQYKVFFT